jgi:hypothetical protein
VPAEFVQGIPLFCVSQMIEIVASVAAAMKPDFVVGL